jgi:predicted GNAT family acetyltransferase
VIESGTAQVTDNEGASRFELHLDGQLAGWIDYRRARDTVALTHAEVLPELRNQGHGEAMVRETLADLKRRGLQAQAVCPFVRAYVRRHPDEI